MTKEYSVLNDRLYTETHEWLLLQNDIGIVGITDYAQDQLHDIVYVDLPDLGKKVEKGEVMLEIESVKAVAEVYAPVSGEIIEVNDKLIDSPELINQSPYNEGWLVKIKLSNIKEIDQLLTPMKYRGIIR